MISFFLLQNKQIFSLLQNVNSWEEIDNFNFNLKKVFFFKNVPKELGSAKGRGKLFTYSLTE